MDTISVVNLSSFPAGISTKALSNGPDPHKDDALQVPSLAVYGYWSSVQNPWVSRYSKALSIHPPLQPYDFGSQSTSSCSEK